MRDGKQEKWNKIILTSLCCLKTTTGPLVLLRSQQGGPVRVRFYLGNWYWFLVCHQNVRRKRFFSFFHSFSFFSCVHIHGCKAVCLDLGCMLSWLCCHNWTGGKIFWIDLQTFSLAFAHLSSHVSCKPMLKGKIKNRTHGCGKVSNFFFFFGHLWMNFEWVFSISGCSNEDPSVCSLGSSSQGFEGSSLPWRCSECSGAPAKSQGQIANITAVQEETLRSQAAFNFWPKSDPDTAKYSCY